MTARSSMACLYALTVVACDEPARPLPSEPPAPAEREAAATPEPEPSGRTVVWVGGDVLPAGSIRRAVREDGDPAAGYAQLLEPAAAVWRRDGDAAFVVVNLETPVATTTRVENDAYRAHKRGDRRVRAPLNGRDWMLDGLRRAGVDAVMLANNHALDQSREGLAETIAAAQAAGLVTTGAGLSPNLYWPIVVGSDGAATAIFTFFEKDFPEPDLPDGQAGLSVLSDESVTRVRRAAEERDAVVVVIHVVAELWSGVKPRWRQWAQRLAEAGADAIAFHGTHVAGPVEMIEVGERRVPVAYQLGNMVSDMGTSANPTRSTPEEVLRWESPQTREGLLMRVEITPSGVATSFLPIWMDQDRWLLNNRVRQGPIRFRLLPLAACGPATDAFADWPAPWGEQMTAWVGQRRDHILTVTTLTPPQGCAAGAIEPIVFGP